MMPYGSAATTKEYAGGSVGGILRKRGDASKAAHESRLAELFVFGYACKVFRDDKKALEIDQGKHLISWMDSSLKIDR